MIMNYPMLRLIRCANCMNAAMVKVNDDFTSALPAGWSVTATTKQLADSQACSTVLEAPKVTATP